VANAQIITTLAMLQDEEGDEALRH
jgi:hypothetical protein